MNGMNPPNIFLRAVDSAGNPAPGAKLYAFLTGTTIPKNLFYDYAKTQPCPHPLVADTEGNFAQVFLEDGGYKIALFDQNDTQLRPPEEPIFGSGGGGSSIDLPIIPIASFPSSEIFLLSDTANDLWDKPDAKCCFRNDFIVKGFTRLRHFKSIFTANSGHASGRYAIYGTSLNGADIVKLVDEFLPDNDDCGVDLYDIDITGHEMLVVCMDPGVDGIPQPVSQSILYMPPNTALSHTVWAGLALHTPLAEFDDEEPPAIIDSSPKYFIRRWMEIGVQ